MVNLHGSLKARQQPGGYLASIFKMPQTGSVLTQPTVAFNSQYRDPAETLDNEQPWYEVVGKSIAAAPVDIVDSIAAIAPGVERGEVNSAVYDTIGLPGFAAWVEQNQGAVEIASGLIGGITIAGIAEKAATKLILAGATRASGIARAVTPFVNNIAKAEKAANAALLEAAASGNALRFWSAGPMREFTTTRIAAGLYKGAVSEIAVVAALHNNSAVWDDDMVTNGIFVGLGLGISGGVAGIGARAATMKWANSVVAREAFANAADPGATERVLASLPMGQQPLRDAQLERGPLKSSEFTAAALNARRDDSAAVTKGLQPRVDVRPEIQTGMEKLAHQFLQVMANKGVAHLPGTSFPTRASGGGAHIITAAHRDPTFLLGATEIGQVPAGASPKQLVQDRKNGLDGVALSRTSTQEQKDLAYERGQESLLFLLNKTWVDADTAEEFARYQPDKIKFRPTAKGSNELVWDSQVSGGRLTLREDGKLSKDFGLLDITDQLGVLEAMNHMLSSGKLKGIVVPKNADWLQLDFALEAARRGVKVDYQSVAKLRDLEDVQLQSFKLKAQHAKKLKMAGKDLDFKARFSLNLSQATTLEAEADAGGDLFMAVLQASRRKNITMSQLRGARLQAMRNLDLGSELTLDTELTGDFFSFNRGTVTNRKNQWLPVLMGTMKDPAKVSWTRVDLAALVTEQKAISQRLMIRDTNAPVSSGLTQQVIESPEYMVAGDIAGAADNQMGGTSGPLSATASQFITQTQRNRFAPMMQAAQTLRRTINRVVEITLDSVLEKLSDHTKALSAASGSPSRLMYNNYASNAAGWDIKAAIPGGKGVVFELADSAANRSRLTSRGQTFAKGMILTDARGVEVTLDSTADAARQSLENEYRLLLAERNSQRIARGLDPIKTRPFYVPPPNTRGKIIGFTMDQNNRVVPGGTIIADSEEQFRDMRAALNKQLKPEHTFVTQDSIEDFHDMWEQAMMGFTAPGDFIDPRALAGPNRQQLGKLTGVSINAQAYEEALDFLKTGYEQVGNGVVRQVFDSQLKIARVRHAANVANHTTPAGAKDIWQTFEETLLGIPGTARPKGINPAVKAIEEFTDKILSTSWRTASGVSRGVVSSLHLRDLIRRVPGFKAAGVKTFDDLAAELGAHMPIADALEYASYVSGGKSPLLTRDVARAVNRIGAGVVLRWLEMPHAIMNMVGIISALPQVAMAKSLPSVGKVNGVGIVDTGRIMARGFKRQFDKNFWNSPDGRHMVEYGDATQDVAELHHQLSLLDSKGAFMRFMTGDPRYANYASLSGKAKASAYLKFKGLEGMASIITDTSENMSRRWAHIVGLELADHYGIVGLEARHNFARNVANDATANYDPLNRPEIFQSAFGTMYGLFLSYTQNYYERMFRWMEDGDFKSVGRSLAIQASMFGVAGVPGFRQLEALMGGHEEDDSLIDGIYRRFGGPAGAVVTQGGVNQLSTLLGLPAVALHTRGDVSIRHPGIDFAAGTSPLPIGLEVIRDIASGMIETVGKMVDPKVPGSARHYAEVMARNMPSRAMKGWLSTLAVEGQEIDQYGNIMSETKNWAEVGYRLMGLRSARQQAEIEGYYMNQKAKAIDADRMAPVRAATRTLIRAGEFNRLPEVFQKYLDAGGHPWNYSSWMQGIVKEARQSRAQNQLTSMMRSQGSQDLVKRLVRMTGFYE